MILSNAYKELFKNENLTENLNKLSNEIKTNELVSEVIKFIEEDKKGQFAPRFQNKMIGLFLGDTDFSEIVLSKIKKLNKKYFIIDFSKNNKFKK